MQFCAGPIEEIIGPPITTDIPDIIGENLVSQFVNEINTQLPPGVRAPCRPPARPPARAAGSCPRTFATACAGLSETISDFLTGYLQEDLGKVRPHRWPGGRAPSCWLRRPCPRASCRSSPGASPRSSGPWLHVRSPASSRTSYAPLRWAAARLPLPSRAAQVPRRLANRLTHDLGLLLARALSATIGVGAARERDREIGSPRAWPGLCAQCRR